MKKRHSKAFYILAFLLTAWISTSIASENTWKTVNYIIDGDTFVTQSGDYIRLLGINTPETGKYGKPGQPFANKARLKLTELISKQNVRLTFGDRYKDRYGRLLAHVYKKDGTWVNAELIKKGLAHVYSFPDNRQHTKDLIKLENKARSNKIGLWNHKRWKTYTNVTEIPDSSIGRFNLFEGKAHHITNTKDKVFINFGSNWRKDFTVEIRKKDKAIFKQSGIDIKEYYKAKKLQIRGVFKPVNGVLITATHPEQLTILD